MFPLIYAWINGWVNNLEAGDLRRHCAHNGVNKIPKNMLNLSPTTATEPLVNDISIKTEFTLSNINTPESIHIFQRLPNYLVGARSSVGLWRLGYGVRFSGPGVAGWVTCPITIKLAIVLMNGLLLWVRQSTLLWRHNGRDGVSKCQIHDCLLNRLYRRSQRKHQSAASLAFLQGIHR